MTHAVFVMDAVDTLSIKKDSSLAMIRAAQLRGWQVSYVQQHDLVYQDEAVFADLRALTLREPFADNLDPALAGEVWYDLGPPAMTPLGDVDVVMLRKDPPFDMEYIYTTYLLERVEQAGTLVVNRPQSIRDCNEKFFATAFPRFTPPLVISRRQDVLVDFQQTHGNVVFKPLDGMGGKNVFRVMDGDLNLRVILENLSDDGRVQVMGQMFVPEIVDGDKRILLVDGEPVPYALARVPMVGEARGNLAAGGTGEGRPLSKRDAEIAAAVGPEVKRRGLIFVGIDVIGDYLTEVNVTCPTCIRELDAQYSLDIAGMLLDRVTAKLRG